MAYNAIDTAYTAHLARIAAADGTESAELPDICNRVADLIKQVVGPILPIPYAWGYPVTRPNGIWPNWVVVPDPQAGSEHSNEIGTGLHLVKHHLMGMLLVGAASEDYATVSARGLPYLWLIDRALAGNWTLDRAVVGLEADRSIWAKAPYAGGTWWALAWPLVVWAYSAEWPNGRW